MRQRVKTNFLSYQQVLYFTCNPTFSHAKEIKHQRKLYPSTKNTPKYPYYCRTGYCQQQKNTVKFLQKFQHESIILQCQNNWNTIGMIVSSQNAPTSLHPPFSGYCTLQAKGNDCVKSKCTTLRSLGTVPCRLKEMIVNWSTESRRKNEDSEEAQRRRKQRAKKRKQAMVQQIEENKVKQTADIE